MIKYIKLRNLTCYVNIYVISKCHASQRTTKSTIRLVRQAKTEINLRIRAVRSESSLIACSFYWIHRSYCRFCRALAQLLQKIYRIRPNYRTYPYKRTVKQFHSLQITASVFLSTSFFLKVYVVGTHFNCIDLSMQFKWVPTTYAFIKKIRRKKYKNIA